MEGERVGDGYEVKYRGGRKVGTKRGEIEVKEWRGMNKGGTGMR